MAFVAFLFLVASAGTVETAPILSAVFMLAFGGIALHINRREFE